MPGDPGPFTVTISREFGCEGYPVSERLQALLEASTRRPWVVLDNELLEAVSRDTNLSAELFRGLGDRSAALDSLLAVLSPRWRTQEDYYRLLAKQIYAFARGGDVILVGRGGSILTQSFENCFHFRLVAAFEHRVSSLARRLALTQKEAEVLVLDRQKRRDGFIRSFLGRDIGDATLYHLILNNGKNTAEQISRMIHAYLGLIGWLGGTRVP